MCKKRGRSTDCDICGKTFSRQDVMKRHRLAHGGEKTFVCGICSKAFMRADQLSEHQRVHDGSRPYVCDFPGCDKSYTSSGNLVIHKRDHSNERPYVCDLCDQSFTRSATLNEHKKTHEEKSTRERYACTYAGCDRSYLSKGSLRDHLTTHDGTSNFKCTVAGCGKVFPSASNLRVHEGTHVNAKPFTCPCCGKTFSQKSNMTTHQTTVHGTERNFKCGQCTLAFKCKSDLEKHERVHSNVRPYRCHFQDCERTFTLAGNRTIHEKNFHEKGRHEAYVKKKEEWIVGLFTKNDIQYDRELHVTYRGCGEDDTWARLDFVLYADTYVVIFSVDEFQHADREVACEVSRMSKVVCSIRASGDNRPILWLRMNPDTFSVDGERVKVTTAEREQVILDTINDSREILGDSNVRVVYMFYDSLYNDEGKLIPEVCTHCDYDASWRELVGDVIVD
jgi:hypothetical protein